MKKIIVAGAGHGGLTAAYNLADKGYDVTVIEKNQRENMGHDWHDALDFSAFDESGIPRPSKDMYSPSLPQIYTNPSATVNISIPFNEGGGFNMDRKVLIKYLIDSAESKGVKLLFGCEILGAVIKDNEIVGINYLENGNEITAECDLLIDAAGLNSPVRKNLPTDCGIDKEFVPRDIFYAYRVYFENTTGEELDPPYNVHLFHMNKPGINWIVTEKGRVDILIGKFGMSGELTQKEIDEGIADFRKKYPFIGEKVLRGGSVGEIPLRRMLPKIVCDGYAAVGDSAGMTIPLNGSGIVLSMKAGKILADTVINAGEEKLTTKLLWSYQYNYYNNLGKGLVLIDILKNFFTYISGENVDYFMEHGVLTAENLAFGNGIKITPEYIFNLVKVSGPILYLVPPLVKSFKLLPILDRINSMIPEEYDEKKVRKWIKLYNAV